MSQNDQRKPTYEPEEGSLNAAPERTYGTTRLGYHNLPRLRETLLQIIEDTESNINLAESHLKSFALRMDEGSRLYKAHAKEWPSEIGPPKGAVTYGQYKAMRKLNTRSSDYITKQYEKYARGPSGNHNVDLVLANEVINTEAKLILHFLDNCIGTVSNTSEYRTIEIFQDWAQDAYTFTGQLRGITTKGAKGEHTETIPTTELDKINKKDAIQFQTLFKTKINSFNEQIAQLLETLIRDSKTNSKVFYDKFLGPTLKFEIEFADSLEDNGSRDSFLGQYARAGNASFAWQLEQLLVDGLKRNENFRSNVQGLLLMIDRRDDYNGFIKQLSAQGSQIKQFFIEESLSTEEQEAFENIVTSTEEQPAIDEEFLSDHNILDNLEDPDAHPQYLLREGGTITGDIEVDEGVTIDGVDLDQHDHDGINTPKIKGSNIEGGTLGTGSIDKTHRPTPPSGLRVKSFKQDVIPPGLSVFDITLTWDGEPGLTYEVQAVPYEY